METETILHKEIDLIQGCVLRMASNSFLLKGWTLWLLAIVLALLAESRCGIGVGLVLGFVILCFWGLDAYFLMTERKYRKLYEWVIDNRRQGNMENLYSLNTTRFDNDVKIEDSLLCKTALLFYLPVLIVLFTFILSQ